MQRSSLRGDNHHGEWRTGWTGCGGLNTELILPPEFDEFRAHFEAQGFVVAQVERGGLQVEVTFCMLRCLIGQVLWSLKEKPAAHSLLRTVVVPQITREDLNAALPELPNSFFQGLETW